MSDVFTRVCQFLSANFEVPEGELYQVIGEEDGTWLAVFADEQLNLQSFELDEPASAALEGILREEGLLATQKSD